MDEKKLYRLESLIKSSLFKLNRVWDGTNSTAHKWLCGGYDDLVKALELVEAEVAKIEDDA